MSNYCQTCGHEIEPTIKLNAFQQQVKKLWQENKKYGVAIEAPRQIGKTTILIELAKKYSKIKPVIIYSKTQNQSDEIKAKLNNFKKIRIVTTPDTIIFQKPNDCFEFYDEIEGEIKPNTLRIYTSLKNKYIFGSDWFDDEQLNRLQALKTYISFSHYNREFECGIQIKNQINSKEEVK